MVNSRRKSTIIIDSNVSNMYFMFSFVYKLFSYLFNMLFIRS